METSGAGKGDRFFQVWSRKSRFAIEGPDNRFSAAWAAWNRGDSVYIAGRTIGGFIKISLHPEGGYRLAFTKDFHSQVRGRADRFATRDLAVWPKPDLTGVPAALAVSLCFPTDHLAAAHPPASMSKRYLIMQAPLPGRAAYVDFVLSNQPVEALEPTLRKVGIPFCRWDIGDGTNISMVGREGPFDPTVLPVTESPRTIVPLTGSGSIGPEHLGEALTAMAWNEPGPGVPLHVIEVGGVTLSADGRWHL